MVQPKAAEESSPVQTVIFLDVDGVLNAGARDHRGKFLLLNKANLRAARRIVSVQNPDLEPGVDPDAARKILATSARVEGPAEGETMEVLSANACGYSDVLVRRLVELLRCTKPEPKVVLASNWRMPKMKHDAEMLRADIEDLLGYEFNWAGKTPPREESDAKGRLACIGEYLRSMSLPARSRVMVLDDFFVAPFNGWTVGGLPMNSTEDAESYLMGCCQAGGSVEMKVIQPLDEFVTKQDLPVQAAVGLTQVHFMEAASFLLHGGGTARGPVSSRLGTTATLAKSLVTAGEGYGNKALAAMLRKCRGGPDPTEEKVLSKERFIQVGISRRSRSKGVPPCPEKLSRATSKEAGQRGVIICL